jgi:hypothetical protein
MVIGVNVLWVMAAVKVAQMHDEISDNEGGDTAVVMLLLVVMVVVAAKVMPSGGSACGDDSGYACRTRW